MWSSLQFNRKTPSSLWQVIKSTKRQTFFKADDSFRSFCSIRPQVPESWSWRTDRADCSRSSGSGWPWKVNAGVLTNDCWVEYLDPRNVFLPSLTPRSSPSTFLRQPENGEGARSGEADLERDAGGGGAAGRAGGPPGWAEASGEGGGQGSGGRHALQRLQPQLGLRGVK